MIKPSITNYKAVKKLNAPSIENRVPEESDLGKKGKSRKTDPGRE